MKQKKEIKLSAKEYAERHGKSKSWALNLFNLSVNYGADLPKDAKEITIVGNQYVITIKQ